MKWYQFIFRREYEEEPDHVKRHLIDTCEVCLRQGHYQMGIRNIEGMKEHYPGVYHKYLPKFTKAKERQEKKERENNL